MLTHIGGSIFEHHRGEDEDTRSQSRGGKKRKACRRAARVSGRQLCDLLLPISDFGFFSINTSITPFPAADPQ